ncbi:MAG: nucleotide exchange factor GrpE [Novipirellula sp. JB048]
MSEEEKNSQPETDERDAVDAVHESDVDAEGNAAAETPAETRDEEIERLRASSESAEKRVLMAQAEAENFRKRMRRDFEDQLRFASLPLVTDLLEVRDNLHRAIEAAGSSSDAAGLKDGVAIVAKQLDETLAKYDVHEIPAEGEPFDPNFHEAISQVPSDEHAAGTVTHVALSGFKMHDRVVRASQVIVSTGAAANAD